MTCPRCGGTAGYFECLTIHGEQHYTWDGEAVNFADGNTFGGKRQYCSDCGKDVTKIVSALREGRKTGK